MWILSFFCEQVLIPTGSDKCSPTVLPIEVLAMQGFILPLNVDEHVKNLSPNMLEECIVQVFYMIRLLLVLYHISSLAFNY